MLPHYTQMNAVPGGQGRMILKKSARFRHGPIRDGEDRNSEMGHGIENLESNLGDLQVPVAVQDLLQHLGVGTGRRSLTVDDPLEEPLAGQPLGLSLPAAYMKMLASIRITSSARRRTPRPLSPRVRPGR